MSRRTLLRDEVFKEEVGFRKFSKRSIQDFLQAQQLIEKVYLVVWTLFSIYSIYTLTEGKMSWGTRITIGLGDIIAFSLCGYVCFKLMKVQENIIKYGTYRKPKEQLVEIDENNKTEQ